MGLIANLGTRDSRTSAAQWSLSVQNFSPPAIISPFVKRAIPCGKIVVRRMLFGRTWRKERLGAQPRRKERAGVPHGLATFRHHLVELRLLLGREKSRCL